MFIYKLLSCNLKLFQQIIYSSIKLNSTKPVQYLITTGTVSNKKPFSGLNKA